MKITFISNYMNHHQLPLCKALHRLLGNDFSFVALTGVSKERMALGYTDMNNCFSFVRPVSDRGITEEEARHLCMDCDILLVGSASDDWFVDRLKAGKITIKFSERYFRKGNSPRYFIRDLLTGILHIRRFQKYPLYYLCASAYTARDVNRFAYYSGRTFKWGYFPEANHNDDVDDMIARKKQGSLIWVARQLVLKHPEAAVYVAYRLAEDGYDFHMEILGNGPLLEKTRQQVEELGLTEQVHVAGAVSTDVVRKSMEQAQIFFFTSDQNEGWGAVLNEAMTSCCAVVASDAAGATNFLVEHGKNGFVFPSGDWSALYTHVKQLMDDSELRNSLAKQAYRTIRDEWNADIAAERLLQLTACILKGDDPNVLFDKGPCSKA